MDAWPELQAPPKTFLPDNGKGGFIVEKNNIGVVAGFVYMTNSKAALLEWIISNPEYRESDRKDAIELLINAVEHVLKDQGIKHIFSIGRNKHLIETHKKLNWIVRQFHFIIALLLIILSIWNNLIKFAPLF